MVSLIGEVERPLGLGSELITITADMFVDRGDHIQLTLTADGTGGVVINYASGNIPHLLNAGTIQLR